MIQRVLLPMVVFAFLSPVFGGPGKAVEAIPATDGKEVVLNPDTGYKFKFEIPGFIPGVDGTMGVMGLQAGVDLDVGDTLGALNMAALGRLEARRNRWGLILDGYYADLGMGGSPPGPLLSTIDLEVKLVLAESLVTYRIFENDRAWIDFIAGARYVYLGLDLGLRVDSAGAHRTSEELSARVVDQVASTARDAVSSQLPALKANLSSRVKSIIQTDRDSGNGPISNVASEIENQISGQIDELRDEIRDRINDGIGAPRSSSNRPRFQGPGIGDKIADRIQSAIEEYAKTAAEAEIAAAQAQLAQLASAATKAKNKIRSKAQRQVAATQSRIQKEAEKKLAKAEAKLAKEIEEKINQGIPETPVTGSESWVDPFVGIRGRCDLWESWYAAFRGDIGGFGINSDLTWNLFGAIGYQLNERAALELGYRHFVIDYQDGGFTFDASLSGPFVGFGIEF